MTGRFRRGGRPRSPLTGTPRAGEAAALESVRGLIHQIVWKFLNRRPHLIPHADDVLAEAHVLALGAVRRFDQASGYKLTTFVGGSLERALNTIAAAYCSPGGLRIPRYLLDGSHGHRPFADAARRATKRVLSIDSTRAYEDEETGPWRHVPRDDSWEADREADESRVEARARTRRLMRALSPRDRCVVSMRYGLTSGRPMTLQEIGNELNLSRERVRQIQARALRAMRGGGDGRG